MKTYNKFKLSFAKLFTLVLLLGMSTSHVAAQTFLEIGEVYNFTQAPSTTELYAIDLEAPGEITIHIDNWISTYNWSLDIDRLYVYNSDGLPVARNEFSSVEDPFLFHMFQGNSGLIFNVGQAGSYTIAVHSGQRWGENWGTTTMQNYEISVTALYVDDAYEPNDTLTLATPITIGSTISAYEWRQINTAEVWGDEDWYNISIDSPGKLRIELVDWIGIYNWQTDYDRLYVYNQFGESIGSNGGSDYYAAMMGGGTIEDPVVIEMNLSHAGNYYLGFHCGNGVNTSTYHFTTTFEAANDPFEPNDDFASAKEVPSAEVWHQAWEWRSLDYTMNVGDDEDFYYFFAADAGEYSLTLEGWIPIFNWGANYDRLFIWDVNENPLGDSPYSWMMGTDPITFNVPAAGKYYLQLHCGGTYSLDGYQFKVSGLINNVENHDQNNLPFQIFPNPASEYASLRINDKQQESLSLNIFDVKGQMVHAEIIKQNHFQIDVSGLSEGVYILELKSENLIGKQKLVIQR